MIFTFIHENQEQSKGSGESESAEMKNQGTRGCRANRILQMQRRSTLSTLAEMRTGTWECWAVSAELLGWSHTAECRGAKRMWIGGQAQPQRRMKKRPKELCLCKEDLCPSCSFVLSRRFLQCFKTQFERSLDVFKDRKKLRADLITSWKCPLPATARIISWPYRIILRKPNPAFPRRFPEFSGCPPLAHAVWLAQHEPRAAPGM